MIAIDVACCFAEISIDMAKVHCRSFGREWDVAKESNGSIVCTKNGLTWLDNCAPCDTWRLLVFKSGSDEDGTGSKSTRSGSYYGGQSPCGVGSILPWCGSWYQGILESSFIHFWLVGKGSTYHSLCDLITF